MMSSSYHKLSVGLPCARLIVPLSLAVALLSNEARAQATQCEQLDGKAKERARALLQSEHPYACCDATISECLRQEPTCKLAVRLANAICRRVAASQSDAEIRRALTRRARSMMTFGKSAQIHLSPRYRAGEGPVTLVLYACARCPFCARMVPELHESVTEGPLVGKVQLYIRPFPLRSHEHSKEGNLAFAAAAEQGRFWDYALNAYADFDAFCPAKRVERARSLELDVDAFVRALESKKTRDALIASKKEGLVNEVDATPTLFINGHRYEGDLDIDAVVDVLEEAYDEARGRQYVEK